MPNNTISTGEEPVRPEKAPKQRFPEDIFYLDFLQRHPEVRWQLLQLSAQAATSSTALSALQAKYEAVDLSSSDPPTARRYAWAQLAYMNQGMSVSAARRAADKDFADELSKYVPASCLPCAALACVPCLPVPSVLQTPTFQQTRVAVPRSLGST